MFSDLKRAYGFTWDELWIGVPFRVLLAFYREIPRIRCSERIELVLAQHADPKKHLNQLTSALTKLSGGKQVATSRDIDAQLAMYSRTRGRKGGKIITKKRKP